MNSETKTKQNRTEEKVVRRVCVFVINILFNEEKKRKKTLQPNR